MDGSWVYGEGLERTAFLSAPRLPHFPSSAPTVFSGAVQPVSRGTGTTRLLVRQEARPSPAPAWLPKSECLYLALLRSPSWFIYQGADSLALGLLKTFSSISHPLEWHSSHEELRLNAAIAINQDHGNPVCTTCWDLHTGVAS